MSMTENEAIDVILKDHSTFKNPMSKAYVMACKALEEIQAYRAIGTIEDFKALKEKDKPKKTNSFSGCIHNNTEQDWDFVK